MVCAPAHKALFGIQGCGFCYFSSPKKRDTITEGGSGNDSKNLLMPDDPPERYEAGTLSSPAIVSLLSGIDFIEETTLAAISERLDELTLYARECLSSIKKAMLYESGGGIVPFNIIGIPAEIVSYELSKVGICTRAGLQCAPLAHKVMDTYNTGTVRLSFSYFNKKSEISKLYKSLCDIVKLY
jgi:selenocysteine lyase/cysteine desulfurase